jgi:hypothetical protein
MSGKTLMSVEDFDQLEEPDELSYELDEGQFSGSIWPDHMPRHPGDPGGFQAFAFGYGYIKALIQLANSEV